MVVIAVMTEIVLLLNFQVTRNKDTLVDIQQYIIFLVSIIIIVNLMVHERIGDIFDILEKRIGDISYVLMCMLEIPECIECWNSKVFVWLILSTEQSSNVDPTKVKYS